MRGVGAGQLPCREERRPVDPGNELVEWVIVEGLRAEEARPRRRQGGPVDREAVPAGLLDRVSLLLRLAVAPLAPDLLVLLADPLDERLVRILAEELPRDADGARGIQDVHDRAGVARLDLHRGVGSRRRGATDEERGGEALAFHLGRDERHLLERGRDEPREADEIGVQLACRLEDPCRRDHDPEIDDLVVVALQDDADDVLADVVDVALDRGHHDQAVVLRCGRVFLGLDERHEVSHGLLHDPGALDDLGQEHLAGAEQVADDVHPVHQRALDDVDRALGGLPGLLRVLDDPVVDPLDEGVDEPVVDRSLPPREVDLAAADAGETADPGGQLGQALGRVGAPGKDDVLDALPKLRIEVVVDRELAGVDDAHVHARGDRVVQEDRVDRLAHGVVAAEAERDVRDPAGDLRAGQLLLDPPRRLDVLDGVPVVLVNAGRDGEDVRVEDDVLGREARRLRQEAVGALGDRDLALCACPPGPARRRP